MSEQNKFDLSFVNNFVVENEVEENKKNHIKAICDDIIKTELIPFLERNTNEISYSPDIRKFMKFDKSDRELIANEMRARSFFVVFFEETDFPGFVFRIAGWNKAGWNKN